MTKKKRCNICLMIHMHHSVRYLLVVVHAIGDSRAPCRAPKMAGRTGRVMHWRGRSEMGCVVVVRPEPRWTGGTSQGRTASLRIEGGIASVMGWARRRSRNIIRVKRIISIESCRRGVSYKRGRPYMRRRPYIRRRPHIGRRMPYIGRRSSDIGRGSSDIRRRMLVMVKGFVVVMPWLSSWSDMRRWDIERAMGFSTKNVRLGRRPKTFFICRLSKYICRRRWGWERYFRMKVRLRHRTWVTVGNQL